VWDCFEASAGKAVLHLLLRSQNNRKINGGKLNVINMMWVAAPSVAQIQLESPLYPSTRMAIRVPSLGFHFSPARYHRLMEILKIFQDSDSENSTSDLEHLWDQADFEGWSSLLTWKVCILCNVLTNDPSFNDYVHISIFSLICF